MKKFSFLLLALLLLLAGCVSKDKQTEQPVLWIVTEESPSDGMNYQAEMAAETFQQTHPGVTVQLEIIPTDSVERSLYLKNLRTKIMSGSGPDVFLLPTGTTLQISASSISMHTGEITVEPLFHDMEQAMRSGVFLDLQPYFEADADLDTAGLQQEVMAAGVVEGARYVLPLRYTMPVLLADLNNETVKSLPLENIYQGIAGLTAYALEAEDTRMATGLQLPTDLSVFPTLYDYGKGKTLITQEEIAQYLQLYQRWRELTAEYQQQMIDTTAAETAAYLNEDFHNSFPNAMEEIGIIINIESYNDIVSYIRCVECHWTTRELPFYCTSLAGVLQNAILAEGLQRSVGVYPLQRMDGSVGAEVTYFGAVGAGCDDVEMAYEYLRLFLTEDYQWDAVRPRTNRSRDNIWKRAPELQHFGLVEDSWPVRAVGAVSPLFDTMQYQTKLFDGGGWPIGRLRVIKAGIQAGVSDASSMDFSILEVTIDEVRFPIYLAEEETLAYALSQLNEADGTPTGVDIDALAEQIWTYLWCHLAEG